MGIHYRKSCASSGACLIASSGYQQFCTGKLHSVCISCCNTPLCNGPRQKKRPVPSTAPAARPLALVQRAEHEGPRGEGRTSIRLPDMSLVDVLYGEPTAQHLDKHLAELLGGQPFAKVFMHTMRSSVYLSMVLCPGSLLEHPSNGTAKEHHRKMLISGRPPLYLE
ncbi:hypothetical protein Z043_116566 [Scleropages formosus]|uniref:Uncharacterized protein n=1 Tax=Scleropages formosus TaxID=113540 RepID=A0A0P7WMW3_SCLFO|nr:hypothetical protein Z043_116566 [Scleropages formosus]